LNCASCGRWIGRLYPGNFDCRYCWECLSTKTLDQLGAESRAMVESLPLQLSAAVRSLTAELANTLREGGYALKAFDVMVMSQKITEFLIRWEAHRESFVQEQERLLDDLLNTIPSRFIPRVSAVPPVPPAPVIADPASPPDAVGPDPASPVGEPDPPVA
jgi:hypothetical protein